MHGIRKKIKGGFMEEELEICECGNKKKIMIGAAIALAGLSLIALGTTLFIKKRKANEEE